MNGFDVCQRLRGDPRCRGTKIVMLTAKGRQTDATGAWRREPMPT